LPTATLSAPAAAAENLAFNLQIDSSPVGAEVFEGDRLLGTTPIQLSIDSDGVAHSPRTFSVRKSGYLPYTIVQGPSTKDARVLAELTAEPAHAPARGTGKKPPVASAPAGDSKSDSDIFMQR
jgi:hypothetical protein